MQGDNFDRFKHVKNKDTVKLGNKELFGHPKIGHRKWFLNTNLFRIKPFLITKFDCIKRCAFIGF